MLCCATTEICEEGVPQVFGIRIKDRMTNAQATEMCGVTNRVNERIDGSLFQWFSHIESGGLIL